MAYLTILYKGGKIRVMTRVLQVINAMYPFRGGMSQVAEDVMRSLMDRSDVEQKIICFNEDAEAGGIITHRRETVHDELEGVEIVRCGSVMKAASQLISLAFVRELSRIMNDFAPDIVVLHYPNPFAAYFLLPFLKKNRRIKFMLYLHLDIIRQKILGKLFHRQNIALLERADVIIATSMNYVRGSKYLSSFADKCKVIPCCVQTGRIAVTPKVERMAESIRQEYSGKTISFSAGRLVPYKGFEYLVDSSAYITEDFFVLIAGGGGLRNFVNRCAIARR